MPKHEVPEELQPSPAYLGVVREVLKLDGIEVVGTPFADQLITEKDQDDRLSLCFNTRLYGVLWTEIPLEQSTPRER
jgi:hypothetical protein